MYTVYEHRNKINGKVYIGITSRPLQERWGHNGSNYKSSPHFYSAIKKYGWDNFDHGILFENLTKAEACKKEKELIEATCANDKEFGYNQTDGGERCKLNADARKKKSIAMMGNKNGLGHKCSEEKKKKISDAQKGRKLTKAHKKKLSEAASKRHTPCSEEKKKTLSKNYPHKKQVYCEELDKVFDSIQQCGKQLGVPPTTISKICKGRGHTIHGYHFRYYNPNDMINA